MLLLPTPFIDMSMMVRSSSKPCKLIALVQLLARLGCDIITPCDAMTRRTQ